MVEGRTLADPAGGWRRVLVYGDDLGVQGRHGEIRVFGSMWLPWERRGDLLRTTRTLREASTYSGSIGSILTRPDAEELGLALIDEVFRRRWITFRALVTHEPVDLELGATALASSVARRLATWPGGLAGRELRLRLARRLTPADGDARAACRTVDAKLVERVELPQTFARSIRPARSAEAIELVRLFSTSIADDWEKRPASLHRRRLSLRAAENLGWSDLAADTRPDEWKFNIAYTRDVLASEPPLEPQRTVQLRLPLID